MVSQNLQAAHAVVSRANVVKIFTSDIIISLLFQIFLLIFLKLQRTHVYKDYKRKPLIGRAKRASCSSFVYGVGVQVLHGARRGKLIKHFEECTK